MADTVSVKSLSVFFDSETGSQIRAGDVFTVSKPHADDLKANGLVVLESDLPVIDGPATNPATKVK